MRITLVLVQIFYVSVVTSKRFVVKTNATWSRRIHRPRPSSDDKIAGGWYVDNEKDFPFMVSIRLHKSHICGGCLLSLNFVATACHCLADVSDDPDDPNDYAKPLSFLKLYAFSVVAGSNNIEQFGKNVQVGKPKSLHFHPKCQHKKSLVYDYAAAILRKQFLETPFVQPVKMYTWDGKEFGKLFQKMFSKQEQPKCVVAGWGDTRRGANDVGVPSPRLKAVEMSVLSEKDCSKAWTELVPSQFTNFSFREHGQICALSKNPNESDCGGDSGSPFVCNGHLVATVSFGTAACATGAPSVYSTAEELLNWIHKNFSGVINMTTTKSPILIPLRPLLTTSTFSSTLSTADTTSETERTEAGRSASSKPSPDMSSRGSISQDLTSILILLAIKLGLDV